MLPLFIFAVAIIATTMLLKWAAARLLFRLDIASSALLGGLSPFLYLFGTLELAFVTWGITLNLDPIFYDDAGNGREVLGLNSVFLVAFVVGMAAMTFLDWLTIRVVPALHAALAKSPRRIASDVQLGVGWCLLTSANLAIWFFWIVVYYAIQFPPELDFDG